MNKRISFYFASVCMMSLFLISCEKDDTIPEKELIERKDIVLTRSQMDFVQSNNQFAFDLFKKVSKNEDGKSVIISPLSVTFALGMVNNGAVGETQREISEALGYHDESIDDLNSYCKTMLEQVTKIDPSTNLEIANMVLLNKEHVPLKEEFTKTVENYFDANVCYKDFAKEDVQSYANRWCEQKTHGMIKKFFTESLPSSIYAIFLNATYFKGIWTNKFKKSDSKKEKFSLIDGNKITVNMMHQQDKFNYGAIGGVCSMLTLPYGNQAFRMVLVLPEVGKSVEDLRNSLSQELWTEIVNRQAGMEVDVKIPSFETGIGTISLRRDLSELGIKRAFGEPESDFSRMCDLPIIIDEVLHNAKIKVDETGSEAAAITAVITSIGAAGPIINKEPKIVEFHADRPFIYAITEVSTGAILFIGQYTGKE